MLNKKTFITLVIIINMIIYFCAAINVWAQDPGDEQETFSSIAPDALILLDLSGSMAWNPAGGDNIWGDSSCAGPTYYSSSGSGHNVNCSRLSIAKRALANILDDDGNNIIDSQDVRSLNIRIGFARFYNGTYKTVRGIGTSYAQIFCGVTGTGASCAITTNSCVSGECIAGESATGGTPLASSLGSVKSYLDTHKAADAAGACRSKFVVVMTDGADTYACEGNGAECQSGMYKRRRAVVAATKALKDAGYKVFVIGFGAAMPDYLENTLNWAAYYGGTDNPELDNTGDTSAYTNVTTCDDAADQTATCQGDSTDHFRATNNDPGYIALSGYAFLAGNADDLNAALRSAFSAISAATYSFTQASIQAVRTVDENFVYEASFQPVDYDPFWIGHLKRYSILSDGSVKATEDWDAGDILSNKAGSTRSVWAYKSGSLTSFTSATITAADLSVTTAAQRDAVINFIRNGETSGLVTDWKLGDVFHTSPMSIATPNFLFYDQWDKSNPKAFNTYRLSHIRTSANGKRIMIIGSNDGQLHAFRTGESASGGGAEIWSFIPPNFLPKLKNIAHSSHPTALGHQYFVDGPLSAAEIWLGSGTIGSTYKSSDDWHTYLVMAEGRGGSTTLWSSSASCDTGFNALYSSTYANYCGYYAFKVDETLNNPIYQWRLGGNGGLSAVDGSHLGQPWSKMFIGRVRINNTEKWVGFIGGGYSGTDCAGGGSCDKRGKGFYVVDLSNGQIIWRYTHSGPAAANSIADGAMNYNLASSPVAVDIDNDGFLDTAYIPDLGGNVWRFKFCSSTDDAGCNTSNWSGGLFYDSTGNVRPIYTSCSVSTDDSGNLWVYFGSGEKTDPTAPNAQERFYAVKDNNRTSTYTVSDLENINAGTYSGIKNGWFIPINGQGEKILADPTIFEGNVYFTTYTPPSGSNLCQQGGEARLYIVNYITGAGVFSAQATAAAAANAAAAAAAAAAGTAAANAAAANAAVAANPTAANIAAAAAANAAATAASAAAASAAAASAAANAAAAAATASGNTVRSEVIGQGVSSAAVISRNPGDIGGKGVFVSTSIVGAGGTSNTRSVFDPTFTNNPPNSLIYWHDLRVR